MKKSELTKEMRWEIAERLAAERLKSVNSLCELVTPQKTIYTQYVKRVIDIVFASIALIITLPINIVIGIITCFDVGRPIFFKQQRLGKDGKIFYIIKFRNMRNTKDERGELLPPSQRVTKIGKILRKTSLDELLNFWSIFKGDMSLIGPRPLVPEYWNRFNKRHKLRFAMRPGLECPPRTKSDSVWTWQEQFENDIWYVENVSFLTDCKMVIRLIQFAFDRKSANARACVQRGIFMGYDLNGCAINMDKVPQEYVDFYENHGYR